MENNSTVLADPYSISGTTDGITWNYLRVSYRATVTKAYGARFLNVQIGGTGTGYSVDIADVEIMIKNADGTWNTL